MNYFVRHTTFTSKRKIKLTSLLWNCFKFLQDIEISLSILMSWVYRYRERKRKDSRTLLTSLLILSRNLSRFQHPTPMHSRSFARASIRDCSRVHTGRVIDNKLMATFVKRTANVGAIQSYRWQLPVAVTTVRHAIAIVGTRGSQREISRLPGRTIGCSWRCRISR